MRRLLATTLTVLLFLGVPALPAQAHGDNRMHRVARCESGFGGEHKPRLNTGNGHYGAYQFTLQSWRWVGGKGYPHHATMRQQTKRARILREKQSPYSAWPYCYEHHYKYRYI